MDNTTSSNFVICDTLLPPELIDIIFGQLLDSYDRSMLMSICKLWSGFMLDVSERFTRFKFSYDVTTADWRDPSRDNINWLCKILRSGDYHLFARYCSKINDLLQSGKCPDAKLFKAACKGENLRIVQIMNPYATIGAKNSAFHASCLRGSYHIVNYLIRDLDDPPVDFNLICFRGYFDIANMIIEHVSSIPSLTKTLDHYKSILKRYLDGKRRTTRGINLVTGYDDYNEDEHGNITEWCFAWLKFRDAWKRGDFAIVREMSCERMYLDVNDWRKILQNNSYDTIMGFLNAFSNNYEGELNNCLSAACSLGYIAIVMDILNITNGDKTACDCSNNIWCAHPDIGDGFLSACAYDQVECVKWILDEFPNIDYSTNFMKKVMDELCKNNSINTLQLLITNGKVHDYQECYNFSRDKGSLDCMLLTASIIGWYTIDLQVDFDIVSKKGYTYLMQEYAKRQLK